MSWQAPARHAPGATRLTRASSAKWKRDPGRLSTRSSRLADGRTTRRVADVRQADVDELAAARLVRMDRDHVVARTQRLPPRTAQRHVAEARVRPFELRREHAVDVDLRVVV